MAEAPCFFLALDLEELEDALAWFSVSWEVYRLKAGEKKFILVGHGQRLTGEVWRGAMKGDPFWGLKALENPGLTSRLLKSWRVTCPRRFAAQDNTGVNRRYVEFLPLAAGAPFALRFDGYIPPELLRDLKTAFGETARKGARDEEPPGDPVVDPPQGAAGRRARGHVQRQGRHSPRTRKDPRPEGVGE